MNNKKLDFFLHQKLKNGPKKFSEVAKSFPTWYWKSFYPVSNLIKIEKFFRIGLFKAEGAAIEYW